MQRASRPGFGRLIAVAAGSVIVCVPLVSYLWETVNRLLSGHVEPRRLAVAAPVLLLFLGCLAVIGRVIQRLDAGFPE